MPLPSETRSVGAAAVEPAPVELRSTVLPGSAGAAGTSCATGTSAGARGSRNANCQRAVRASPHHAGVRRRPAPDPSRAALASGRSCHEALERPEEAAVDPPLLLQLPLDREH